MVELYNGIVSKVEMPARFKRLPVDSRGYPVPMFVKIIDGVPDFRVVRTEWVVACAKYDFCWLCGERLGRHKAFVIGPMCTINRVTSEPPSHLDCARFAVKTCPFMLNPERIRNEADLPEEREDPRGGIHIRRNPGVQAIWVAKGYSHIPHTGLFRVGDALSVEWWARGRRATREEVMASIDSGLPLLRETAQTQGPNATIELDRLYSSAMRLVPA